MRSNLINAVLKEIAGSALPDIISVCNSVHAGLKPQSEAKSHKTKQIIRFSFHLSYARVLQIIGEVEEVTDTKSSL